MFKKNNFFFGFGLAMLVTLAIFGALYLINFYLLSAMFGKPVLSESTLLIVGLGMNLFFVNYYTKFRADATAKGIVTFTLICAGYIIYTYFGSDLGLKRE